MNSTELFTSPDYRPAEKYADEYAGDCLLHVVVIEDFDREEFIVMVAAQAGPYLAENDGEIQYDARPQEPE